MRGKHWSGRKHSEASKTKMREARKAYWQEKPHSRKQYYQKKTRPRRGKVVLCKGIIYENLCYAARENNLTREQLRSVLNRSKNTGVINGLRFSYVVFEFDSTKSL